MAAVALSILQTIMTPFVCMQGLGLYHIDSSVSSVLTLAYSEPLCFVTVVHPGYNGLAFGEIQLLTF